MVALPRIFLSRFAARVGSLDFADIRANSHGRAPRKEHRVQHIDDEWRVCRCCRGQAQSAQERRGKDARGLVLNFCFLFRELSDEILVPTVAGITADSTTVTLAREYGYALLLPDGRKVREDARYLRLLEVILPLL